MAGSFPSLRGGLATALYPFTRRITFDTGCTYFSDGTEQRRKRRAPLFEFDWTMNNLDATDTNAILTHFSNQRGGNSSDSTLTIGSTTWAGLAFMTDRFSFVQSGPQQFQVRMAARQTQNGGYATGSVPTAWPTFSSGAKLQYPYGAAWRYLTTLSESPTGKRYAYSWWGASISGQPTRALRAFDIQLVLPDADAVTMETFFTGIQGRLNTFSFTDPFNATTYTKVRFDTDTLELNYQDINKVSVNVTLVETA